MKMTQPLMTGKTIRMFCNKFEKYQDLLRKAIPLYNHTNLHLLVQIICRRGTACSNIIK